MSDAITDKTILDMIEEGKNNFVSSRFDDAAKLFGSTVRNLEKHQLDMDAIYFSYARIVALNKANKHEQEILTLEDLSSKCQRLALSKAMERQKEEINSFEKSTFMNYTQRIMKNMGLEEERESMVLSLVQLYKSLIEEKNTSQDVQENFQEKIIEFSKEFDHPNLDAKFEKLKLAGLLEKSATDLISSEKLHVDVIAANKYIQAASIYLEYSMNKEMKDMLERALKGSKHGQFDKFGFVKITRPPRAKDDLGKEIDPDPDITEDMIKDYMNILLLGIEG